MTPVAPVKPVPLMATDVPPAAGPLVGEILVTVGIGTYVNWSAAEVALVPPGVIIVTSTVPVPAGEVAEMLVSEFTIKLTATMVSNLTPAAPLNPEPLIVMEVPPSAGPLFGEMEDTIGTGTYVNWSAAEVALVPPSVMIVTSTVPVPAGEVAVMLVSDITLYLEDATVPNLTVVAPVNPVPVIVTDVLPVEGPLAGEIPDIVGAGT
jgi:hypothetical protein